MFLSSNTDIVTEKTVTPNLKNKVNMEGFSQICAISQIFGFIKWR